MTFLQPFVLWGLPLILVPVMIHLINRMRHRSQPWAAMRFILSATRASTSHAKLRQFLILLFRVLAVAMLIFFVARPLAGGWMGWMLSPAPDVVIVLLDRSASMEAKMPGNISKREQALKMISQAAKEFEGASRLVLIDNALRAPQEVVNASALNDLSVCRPSDTAADIPTMLQNAFNYLMENRAGSTEIWIASDLQRSNWQPDDPRFKTCISQLASLPQKVRLRLLALTQSPERNTSIALEDIVRKKTGSGAELQFSLDLQRNVESADPFPVQVTLDGAPSEAQVAMDSQSMRWRYKIDLGTKKEGGWGSFRVPADGNAQDNVVYFGYGGETPLRAVVVSSDAASGRFFKIAVSAVTREKDAAQVIAPGEFKTINVDAQCLIVWQAPLPAGADAERIQAFVEQGGAAVFFPPEIAASQQFDGVSWGDLQAAPEEKMFHIVRWDEEQGPLARGEEGFSLPLAQTDFKRRQLINGQKAVLAAFDDGVPFLTRQIVGRGQIYFCSSLPHGDWSTLGDGPVLVPMIQRMLQSGSRRLQQAAFVNAGELSPADQQKQWTCIDSTAKKDIRTDAGVYRSGGRLLVVNRARVEDDPEILDVNEAKGLFNGVSFQMLQEKQTQTDVLQGEIWRLFLFAMLLFLIGEGILILPGKSIATKSFAGPVAPEVPRPAEPKPQTS